MKVLKHRVEILQSIVEPISATNVVLMHMGVENDTTCSFCKNERNAINHIFFEMCQRKALLGTVTDGHK